MASKLSLDNVVVNQLLAQIKTGDIFKVDDINRIANKATIIDAEGNEKIVSKATLERWYREATDDEVQKWHESATAEQTDEGADASQNDAGAETEEPADEAVQNEASEDGTVEGADAVADEGAGEPVGLDGEPEEGAVGSTEEPVGGDSEDGGDAESDEGVNSPVTPSNAGKDKDKAKEPKKQEPKNAALMKVRQTIIDTILADSPSIQLKKTTSYDVLKEKHNFAEITHGSNRFNVSVMSKCLTEDQLNKVKVNPASFGWSIDADFTVFDEGDIETAVQLIRQSRKYRLANPVTRKKKEKK